MPAENYKRLALIVTVVGVTTLTWAVSKSWLTTPGWYIDIGTMLLPSLMFTVLGATVSVAFGLLRHKADRLAAILASWATFTVFWRPDVWYVSVLPVFAVSWYEASRSIGRDLQERRILRVGTSLRSGMRPILLAVFLMVSLGYYLLPSSRVTDLNAISSGIKQSIDSAYDTSLVRSQLAELPQSSSVQVRAELGRKVDDFVHRWLGPLSPYIPPLLAFLLFLTLWSVNFIFRELGVWAGTGIFSVMKATGFVTVREEDAKAQVVEL